LSMIFCHSSKKQNFYKLSAHVQKVHFNHNKPKKNYSSRDKMPFIKEGTYDVQQNGTLLHTEEEEEDVLSAGPSRKKLHVENFRYFRKISAKKIRPFFILTLTI
jgi:hypothetical protein